MTGSLFHIYAFPVNGWLDKFRRILLFANFVLSDLKNRVYDNVELPTVKTCDSMYVFWGF